MTQLTDRALMARLVHRLATGRTLPPGLIGHATRRPIQQRPTPRALGSSALANSSVDADIQPCCLPGRNGDYLRQIPARVDAALVQVNSIATWR